MKESPQKNSVQEIPEFFVSEVDALSDAHDDGLQTSLDFE